MWGVVYPCSVPLLNIWATLRLVGEGVSSKYILVCVLVVVVGGGSPQWGRRVMPLAIMGLVLPGQPLSTSSHQHDMNMKQLCLLMSVSRPL